MSTRWEAVNRPMSPPQAQATLEADEAEALYAPRVRVYSARVRGSFRRAKWAILIACLSIYYVLPWIRWDRGPNAPDQAVLLDIWNERFWFFNLEFWPNEIYYLTGLLITAAVSLFLVTSVLGRVWCGYTCPQTVWTDLFMFIERQLEGDRNARLRQDAGPLTIDIAWRKLAKHAIWVAIAFWTGGAWIMYFVNAPNAVRAFWGGYASTEVYLFTGIFTLTTYPLAGWAREQVCMYMCPWPRFQSAMLDEQSITTTYQAWRGEPRGKLKTKAAHGDCIDCGACVHACPTGVDIREGIQLGCINCGLCIDACNTIMEKVGRPKWLITWDTLADQAAKAAGQHKPFRFWRTRTAIYAALLLLAGIAMATAVTTRPGIKLVALHDRAPLFLRISDGSFRNAYTVKISNKSLQPVVFELRSMGLPGATLSVAEQSRPAEMQDLTVGPDRVGTFRILVGAVLTPGQHGSTPFDFVIKNTSSGETATYRAAFLSPPPT